jgi:hypothetical protein
MGADIVLGTSKRSVLLKDVERFKSDHPKDRRREKRRPARDL